MADVAASAGGGNVDVRCGGPEDLEVLVRFNVQIAWVTEQWKLDEGVVRRGVQRVLEHAPGSPASKGFYLVAERDGRIIGSCLVTFEWSDWQARDYWWVQSVFVEPECRGQGIFRSIYEEVKRRAEAAEAAPSIRLYVEHDNEGAKATYSKLGMKQSHYLMFEQDFTGQWAHAPSPAAAAIAEGAQP